MKTTESFAVSLFFCMRSSKFLSESDAILVSLEPEF